jgi:hypothetical protein
MAGLSIRPQTKKTYLYKRSSVPSNISTHHQHPPHIQSAPGSELTQLFTLSILKLSNRKNEALPHPPTLFAATLAATTIYDIKPSHFATEDAAKQ